MLTMKELNKSHGPLLPEIISPIPGLLWKRKNIQKLILNL